MKSTKLQSFLLFPILLLFTSSCSFFQNCETGKGEILEVEVKIEHFSSLEVSSRVKVFLEQSPQQKVTIKAQENLIRLLDTELNGETWDIRFNRCVTSENPIEIYIKTSELNEIGINGSGSVIGKSMLSTDLLDLSINGSGDIDLLLAVKELNSEISGSGTIRLDGNTKSHKIEIDGSGDVKAFDLRSDATEIEINGSGDAKINASYSLDVEINGSGDVYYKGNVKQISSDINGSGNLHQEQ